MAEAGVTKGGPIPLWPTRCCPLLYKARNPSRSCLRIKLTEVFDAPWRLGAMHASAQQAPPCWAHGDGRLTAFVPYARMDDAGKEVEQRMPPPPRQFEQRRHGAR